MKWHNSILFTLLACTVFQETKPILIDPCSTPDTVIPIVNSIIVRGVLTVLTYCAARPYFNQGKYRPANVAMILFAALQLVSVTNEVNCWRLYEPPIASAAYSCYRFIPEWFCTFLTNLNTGITS